MLKRHPWLPLYLSLLITLIIWGAAIFNLTPDDYQQAALESDTLFARLIEPWNHWDTPFYLSIAENWYSPGGAEISFPPVYAILVGALGRILGGAYLPASLLISWVSLAIACALIYDEFQAYTDAESSLRAVKYLLIFPTAFFFFAGYTESIFLVFLVLAMRGARKEIWWQAGMFGLLASMTRFIGIFVAIPFAWIWFQKPLKEKVRIAAWLSPIPIVFLGWIWLTDKLYGLNPISAGLKFWYIKTDWPWVGLFGSIKSLIEEPKFFGNYQYADVLSVFLFMAAVIYAFRKKWIPEALFMGSLMVVFLIKVLEFDLLISTSRYVLVLYPSFLLLAEWGKKKWFDVAWSILSVVYMFQLSIFFFVGK
ncbi:MAG: hypothetical protein JW757_10885 [Anaerolineales bacterium]|nr:hypothetical protein [Anaerolineales bacterium]